MLLFILFIVTICSSLTEAFPIDGLPVVDENNAVEVDLFIQQYLIDSLNTSIIVVEDDIKYYFYSREIKGTIINKENICNISFDASKETVFVIHGWENSYETDMPQTVKNAYLDSRDINIILVDWSTVSKESYITSKSYVPQIGNLIGEFILFLIESVDLSMDKTALVGFSLGAHIAGNAGRMLDGSPNHLIGLDPAGPLYYITVDEEKLSPGDAQFVQVIHTCAGLEGYLGQLGDADYRPNGGIPIQPGCGEDSSGSCSHSRAYLYYSESLRTGGFLSLRCSSYTKFFEGLCNRNDIAYMGNDAVDRSNGSFYLTTNSESPFVRL